MVLWYYVRKELASGVWRAVVRNEVAASVVASPSLDSSRLLSATGFSLVPPSGNAVVGSRRGSRPMGSEHQHMIMFIFITIIYSTIIIIIIIIIIISSSSTFPEEPCKRVQDYPHGTGHRM